MKIKFILATAILALAGAASSNANTATYGDGDLLLGIRSTDSATYTSCVLVNLGSYTNYNFNNTIASFTNTGSNLKGALDNTFGNTWYGRSDIVFSVVGKVNANSDYVTSNVSGAYTKAGSGITTLSSAISNMGSALTFQLATTYGTSTNVVVQANSSDYTYFYYNPDSNKVTNPFNYPVLLNKYETTTDSGLYMDLLTKNVNTTVYGTATKQIKLGSDATLSFTDVPEPSTYAMMVGGLGVLAMLRRRISA